MEESEGGDNVDCVAFKEVGHKFDVAMVRTAVEFEGGALEFKGDAIKELLKVFINLTESAMLMLEEVLNGCKVREGYVNAGFIFAICKHMGWEGFSLFKSSSEGGGDNGAEMGLNGMHDGNGASVDGVGFGDGNSGRGFSSSGSDAADETKLDEAKVEVGKATWKLSKQVYLELMEAAGSGDWCDIFEEMEVGVR